MRGFIVTDSAGNLKVVQAGAQTQDADLDALAALGGTGFAARTAADTWALRSLAAGANISVSNPAGIAGDPSIAVTGIGSTLQAWDADLDALAALSSTAGMVARTGAGAFTQRTITAGSGISVTNGDGSGNPTIALASAATSGSIFTAVVKLTDAQIKSLSTTPVQILAAQGSGIVIQVVFLAAFKNLTATYSTAQAFHARYAGISAALTTDINFTNSTNLQTGRALQTGATNTDGTDVRNVGVVIRADGNVTGGNAANFITFMLGYSLFDTTRTS